ncbi:MFS transporter [Escherichia coli]
MSGKALSDKQGDRKLLILLCCLFESVACALFAWNRNYFILLSTGVLLSSFASTANPQMLPPSPVNTPTEQAVRRSCSVHFYVLRISLAWVIGPPLAYELAMGFSFKVMYLTAAIAFVVCGLIVWLFFAINTKKYSCRYPTREKFYPPPTGSGIRGYFFVVCSMMWAANNLYMINMPLFMMNCI